MCGHYLRLLCPLVILMCLDSIADATLRGMNRQVAVMFCNILDLVISIGFIYFAVPHMGSVGYIVSIYLSTILNTLISMTLLIKTTNIQIRCKWYLLPILSAIVTICVILFFKEIVVVKISGFNLAFLTIIYISFYLLVSKTISKISG